MGYPVSNYPGNPAPDNNWVSYYELFRDGVALDKVAKGTFYFDHSAGADLAANYEVRTVDGAGNVSPKIAAAGPAAQRATVVDDATAGGFQFSGQWDHAANLLPAHAHTISSSSQKGAVAQIQFQGRQALVFSKLARPRTAARWPSGSTPLLRRSWSTYSGDDIFLGRVHLSQAPCRRRTAPTSFGGLLGEHNSRAKGAQVYVDGLRVEPK